MIWQFTHRLWDQYLTDGDHNLLKTGTTGHNLYNILGRVHNNIQDNV